MSFKQQVIHLPIIGQAILMIVRSNLALSCFWRPLSERIKWVFNSRELSNFTCELEDINRQYLAALIADINDLDSLSDSGNN